MPAIPAHYEKQAEKWPTSRPQVCCYINSLLPCILDTFLVTALVLRMALQLQMSEFCAARGILFPRTNLLKNLMSSCTEAQWNVRREHRNLFLFWRWISFAITPSTNGTDCSAWGAAMLWTSLYSGPHQSQERSPAKVGCVPSLGQQCVNLWGWFRRI